MLLKSFSLIFRPLVGGHVSFVMVSSVWDHGSWATALCNTSSKLTFLIAKELTQALKSASSTLVLGKGLGRFS